MLYDQIKADRITAMKNKDEDRKRVLSVLLGEVDRNRGAKELTDEVVLAAVKKMVKAATENIEILGEQNPAAEEHKKDKALLEAFLPKALSLDEIRKIMQDLKGKHGGNNGAIMKEAKEIAKACRQNFAKIVPKVPSPIRSTQSVDSCSLQRSAPCRTQGPSRNTGRCGGTGRRSGFKIRRPLKACRFDSCHRHFRSAEPSPAARRPRARRARNRAELPSPAAPEEGAAPPPHHSERTATV